MKEVWIKKHIQIQKLRSYIMICNATEMGPHHRMSKKFSSQSVHNRLRDTPKDANLRSRRFENNP